MEAPSLKEAQRAREWQKEYGAENLKIKHEWKRNEVKRKASMVKLEQRAITWTTSEDYACANCTLHRLFIQCKLDTDARIGSHRNFKLNKQFNVKIVPI